MNYTEFNTFCHSLKATTYIQQWGGAHVWKVGGEIDGKVTAKVFAIGGWEHNFGPAYTFKTSDYHFDLLQEQGGFRPAPYMASRGMKWIQQYKCRSFEEDHELKYYIEESYKLASLGLTKKLRMKLKLL